MHTAPATSPFQEITLITDPVVDAESRRIVQAMAGCRRLLGSPAADGTPVGSRSIFALSHAELAAGGLEARIDLLLAYGIGVHRIVGDHPAVRRANRRLGYV